MAKAAGSTLQELFSVPKTGRAKSSVAPRYRHPDDPTLIWTGRGRMPRWLRDAVTNGHAREEFAIG